MEFLAGPFDKKYGIGAFSDAVVENNGDPNTMVFRSEVTDTGNIRITGYEAQEEGGRAVQQAFIVEYRSGEFTSATAPASRPRLEQEVVEILTQDDVRQARRALSPEAFLATLAACEAASSLERSITTGRRMNNNANPFTLNSFTVEHGETHIHVASGMRESLTQEAATRIRRVFR